MKIRKGSDIGIIIEEYLQLPDKASLAQLSRST
jgi:hypothetical protein